jgi:phosphoglycolate phosphatase
MTIVTLFDIDGTILKAHGAGGRAVRQALRDVFGTDGPNPHPFDGKTDPLIVRELMSAAGIPADEIEAGMTETLDRYLTYLEAELAAPGSCTLLPGVGAVLDAVHDDDALVLGMLTGNILVGAELKLRAVGLDPSRFLVGAFGSDDGHRPALPAIALARANEQLDAPITGDQLIIIGDTPHDLTCGRGIGARAIGVETGRYTAAQLAPFAPVAIFADLQDTDAVLHALRHAREPVAVP